MPEPKRLPLQFAPGLYRAGTVYQSQGRWYNANLVRFVADNKRPVGGWRRMVDHTGANLAALAGVPRGAHAWTTDDGGRYAAFATTEKLYINAGGVLTDITPVGFTVGRTKTTIPQPGASLAHPSGWKLEVTEGDGRRVTRLRLHAPEEATPVA